MTLSHLSARFGVLSISIFASAALLIGAPQAHAQSNNKASRFYTVELAEPAAQSRMIIRGVMFSCEGTNCRAAQASSAPKNVCANVAREFGEVVGFSAGNRTLSADEISTCNAKKKINIASE